MQNLIISSQTGEQTNCFCRTCKFRQLFGSKLTIEAQKNLSLWFKKPKKGNLEPRIKYISLPIAQKASKFFKA